MFYKVCEKCGAALDPNEKCNCDETLLRLSEEREMSSQSEAKTASAPASDGTRYQKPSVTKIQFPPELKTLEEKVEFLKNYKNGGEENEKNRAPAK